MQLVIDYAEICQSEREKIYTCIPRFLPLFPGSSSSSSSDAPFNTTSSLTDNNEQIQSMQGMMRDMGSQLFDETTFVSS